MPTLTLLDDAMLRGGRMVPAINRLGGGTIAMAGSQQPWRIVGAESVVYQLRQQSGRVLALRCFFTDTPEPSLVDRYKALSNEATVRQLRPGGPSPIVGQITYLADGLSLPGPELRSVSHPIIAMDWVMGPTLIAAADRACRSRDMQYLTALAEAWRVAMEALHAVQFVHGNLTGDNAMVRPREGIALVDYDTADWPGAPKVKQLEPRPGYRHPKGVPSAADRRDDFAALVVYTSLRLLALWPELREEHGDPASQLGGTVLFSARDLANPDGSALFGKVRVIDDPAMQILVGTLRDACRARPDDVPHFLDVLRKSAHSGRHVSVSGMRPLPRPPEPGRENLQRMNRLNGFLLAGDDEGAYRYWRTSGLIDDPAANREVGGRILEIERRRALRAAKAAAEQADHAAVVRQWESGHLQEEPAAIPLKPVVERARKRSVAVERLRIALEQGDAAIIGQLWPEVRSDRDASVFAAQANEVIAKLFTAAIAGAIERGDDAAIVKAVKETEANGFAIGLADRRAARAAAGRIKARERLSKALAADDRVAISDMALSGLLDEMGEFDATTTRQIMRALATGHLLRAIATDDDFSIYNAYEAEVFGGISGVPAELEARVTLAVNRVRWLRTVRSALKQRDVQTVRAALAAIPERAEAHLSQTERSRMRRMIRREDALAKLEPAIASRNDNAIIDALNEIEAAGAMLPPDLNWEAIRGVIDRLSLITSIRRAATAETVDHARLARLLAQAREEMGGETPYLGSHLDFVALEQDVWRAAHRARVRDALRTNDDKAIVAAALPDLYGAIATLQPAERDRVQRAIASHRGAPALATRPAEELEIGN
jgi:hypothetical protein